MLHRKGGPGFWAALAALWALSWAVAPWLGAALALTAPAEAADAAVRTDVFDPALRDLKVSFNGAAWTEGADYTYVGGVFTTVPGKITVPAATVTQDAVTGAWQVSPGSGTLTVTGTV